QAERLDKSPGEIAPAAGERRATGAAGELRGRRSVMAVRHGAVAIVAERARDVKARAPPAPRVGRLAARPPVCDGDAGSDALAGHPPPALRRALLPRRRRHGDDVDLPAGDRAAAVRRVRAARERAGPGRAARLLRALRRARPRARP